MGGCDYNVKHFNGAVTIFSVVSGLLRKNPCQNPVRFGKISPHADASYMGFKLGLGFYPVGDRVGCDGYNH